MSVTPLTQQTFDDALENHSLLVVDFWAQWCGPCRIFSEILESVSNDYPDIFFTSVNVETEQALAQEFAVQSIPFVMIIRNRTVVYAEAGALSEKALRELLDQAKKLQEKK